MFNKKELEMILILVLNSYNEITKTIDEWIRFEEDPPEHLLKAQDKYLEIMEKLMSMIK